MFRCEHKRNAPDSVLESGAKVLGFLGTGWEICPNFIPILSQLSFLCFSQTILIYCPAEDVTQLTAHLTAVHTGGCVKIYAFCLLCFKPFHQRNIIIFAGISQHIRLFFGFLIRRRGCIYLAVMVVVNVDMLLGVEIEGNGCPCRRAGKNTKNTANIWKCQIFFVILQRKN